MKQRFISTLCTLKFLPLTLLTQILNHLRRAANIQVRIVDTPYLEYREDLWLDEGGW